MLGKHGNHGKASFTAKAATRHAYKPVDDRGHKPVDDRGHKPVDNRGHKTGHAGERGVRFQGADAYEATTTGSGYHGSDRKPHPLLILGIGFLAVSAGMKIAEAGAEASVCFPGTPEDRIIIPLHITEPTRDSKMFASRAIGFNFFAGVPPLPVGCKGFGVASNNILVAAITSNPEDKKTCYEAIVGQYDRLRYGSGICNPEKLNEEKKYADRLLEELESCRPMGR